MDKGTLPEGRGTAARTYSSEETRKPRIWYISARETGNSPLFQQAASQMGVLLTERYFSVEGVTQSSHPRVQALLREIEKANPDVVICRGRMERILREARLDHKIPVIPIQFLGSSTFSLIAHVLKTHPEELPASGAKAAVFSHRPLLYNRETVRFLFHLELVNVILEDTRPEYIRQKLREAQREGASFVLGGMTVKMEADKLGIHAYHNPEADEYESFYRTLELAVVVVSNTRRQRESRQMLEGVMDYAFEGMVLLDPEGRISYYNSRIKQLVEAEGGELLGRPLWEVIPELDRKQLQLVLERGENIYGNILRIRERVVLVNAVPYKRNGEIQGAIVHINQKEQVENLETQIKTEIYTKGRVARYHFPDIKGESPAIEECRYQAKQFAKHHANILLLGESGTGKELFAQSIHNYSMRKDQPFVAVNCGALPMSLLESELFGYVGGAFTGASRQGKKGLIEQADKGTVFLDEISEMDLQGQVRLLRVLEERVITKVGDDRVIPVDVRIIAASNRNLYQMVKEGRFRADLYYRLHVLTLRIPPLRERGRDVLLLAREFLDRYGKAASKELQLTPEAEELLLAYRWPGNVRQLRNFCERLAVISNQKILGEEMIRRQLQEIYAEDLEAAGVGSLPEEERGQPERQPLSPKEEKEYRRLTEALNACGGNRTQAAAMLGMARSSLWRKMKKYHIEEFFPE